MKIKGSRKRLPLVRQRAVLRVLGETAIFCECENNTFPAKDDGFSVLEAVMAVAILSIALLPLLNLQSQFVKTVESYERVKTHVTLEQQILERLKVVNLGARPEGQDALGQYNLTWAVSDSQMQRQAENESRWAAQTMGSVNYRSLEKTQDRFTYLLRPVDVQLSRQNGEVFYRTRLYKLAWQTNYTFQQGLF